MTDSPQFLPPPVAPGTAQQVFTQPTPPIAPSVPTEGLAAELVSKGVVPEQVDYAATLAELQRQLAQTQLQMQSMLAERGIPADPVEAAVKNLTDHINARAAQLPMADFSEVQKLLTNLPTDTAQVTPTHSELLMTTVHELVDMLKHADLGYVRALATAVHKEVLKARV
jgi:hypothetical protein